MNTIPWYTSAIVRQQIVQMIIAGLGLFGIVSDIDWSQTVESLFAGIAALTAVWTVITRIYKPTPAISQTAVDKEVEMVKAGKIPASPTGPPTKQGGFARPLMLALLLAVSVPVLFALPACTTLSQVKNPTFDDHLKDVTDKATIAVQTVNAALNAHLISSAQATAFRDVAANASTILHGAETLRGTDLTSAQGQLDLAEALLTSLQTYLTSRGAK